MATKAVKKIKKPTSAVRRKLREAITVMSDAQSVKKTATTLYDKHRAQVLDMLVDDFPGEEYEETVGDVTYKAQVIRPETVVVDESIIGDMDERQKLVTCDWMVDRDALSLAIMNGDIDKSDLDRIKQFVTLKLNGSLLNAAVEMGTVDKELVAKHSEVVKKAPYAKVNVN